MLLPSMFPCSPRAFRGQWTGSSTGRRAGTRASSRYALRRCCSNAGRPHGHAPSSALSATKPACASWLAAHGADLLSAACFKPAHELFVYAGKNARQNRILLAADEAVRLAALDDAACALFLARKFAPSRSIDPESRSRLLLVASCLGDDEDRRRAESVAAEFAARAKVGGPIAPAAAFSLVAAHIGKGVMPLAEAWGELASRGAPDGPLVPRRRHGVLGSAQKKTPGFASPEDARAVERVALWACDLAARTPLPPCPGSAPSR